MPVEQFTKTQFEAALPCHRHSGNVLFDQHALEAGQWVYRLPVTAHVALRLYSGIGANGLSAACGKDSIRVVVVRLEDGKVYGSKLQRWVTRQTGWEGRLTGLLREMWKMALRCGPCTKFFEFTQCNGFWGVYRCRKPGANKGRLFRKCDGACGGFEWLSEAKEASGK